MEFKNKPNKSYIVDDSGVQKLVWESRSTAVNLVILMNNGIAEDHVLVSQRGPNAADYRGKWNVIAGYLDWDETGPESAIRECWEEVGFNLPEFMKNGVVLKKDLDQPWHVKTLPSANRQNISLRYGVYLKANGKEFPWLTLENNEVKGEVSTALWMPISDIDKHEWAFGHDQVIKDYLTKINTIKKR